MAGEDSQPEPVVAKVLLSELLPERAEGGSKPVPGADSTEERPV